MAVSFAPFHWTPIFFVECLGQKTERKKKGKVVSFHQLDGWEGLVTWT